jgi:hypothetical protein
MCEMFTFFFPDGVTSRLMCYDMMNRWENLARDYVGGIFALR